MFDAIEPCNKIDSWATSAIGLVPFPFLIDDAGTSPTNTCPCEGAFAFQGPIDSVSIFRFRTFPQRPESYR